MRGKETYSLGCQGGTRTVEGEQTMERAATSVASMVTLPGRLFVVNLLLITQGV